MDINIDNNEIIPSCRTRSISNDYADFIKGKSTILISGEPAPPDPCIQIINDSYSVTYLNRESMPPFSYDNYNYESVPKLLGLMDKESLDASGILQLQYQPNLNLRGQGIIIGFVDTGIDYASVNDGCVFGYFMLELP